MRSASLDISLYHADIVFGCLSASIYLLALETTTFSGYEFHCSSSDQKQLRLRKHEVMLPVIQQWHPTNAIPFLIHVTNTLCAIHTSKLTIIIHLWLQNTQSTIQTFQYSTTTHFLITSQLLPL